MKDGEEIKPNNFRAWLKIMAGPSVVFFTLPWLMVLLTLGTIMQKDMGLYDAQRLFLSSWILWLGPIPLPGAYTTIGVITAGLLVKFLMFSPWRAHQAGIILTHLGILVLLVGGLITAITQREGFLLLKEGQSGNLVSDYHDRILTIEKDGAPVETIPFENMESRLRELTLPFKITAENICRNCRPVPVSSAQDRHGLAERVTLQDAPPDKANEANLSGIVFRVTGAGEGQDGTYISMEEIPHRPEITMGDNVYTIYMGRALTKLPFDVELKDFKRELHPGTDMARGFSSDVIVRDGSVAWPYHIHMNEPLRYKGYTFYQASFSQRPDGEYSVLSIVENKGRIFPYLASAIIFAGLLLHVIIRMRSGKGKAA